MTKQKSVTAPGQVIERYWVDGQIIRENTPVTRSVTRTTADGYYVKFWKRKLPVTRIGDTLSFHLDFRRTDE